MRLWSTHRSGMSRQTFDAAFPRAGLPKEREISRRRRRFAASQRAGRGCTEKRRRRTEEEPLRDAKMWPSARTTFACLQYEKARVTLRIACVPHRFRFFPQRSRSAGELS